MKVQNILAAGFPLFAATCLSSENRTLPEAFPIAYGTEAPVELGTGLWGIPLPFDFDGDGIKDMVLSCPDRPYRGTYYYRNIGTPEFPFFDHAVKISNLSDKNLRFSEVEGHPHVFTPGARWEDFFNAPFAQKIPVQYDGPILEDGIARLRSNTWNYVDWDDDGDLDVIVGLDSWDDYGWDNAFDSLGNWANGPLHGWVYLLENVEGRYVNRGRIQAGGRDIDMYGAPIPCVADFDGDGDLDLICSSFMDELTWFENVGTRKTPVFAEGRKLVDREGEVLRFHICMINPVVTDFDGDGKPDLIVSDEDGSVVWLRNTGQVRNRMPVFEDPVKLMQRPDLVKFGALATPCSYDWNGNGREDIITGNSAGEIAWIENLTGSAVPKWGRPKLFRVNGRPLRIRAGHNGSIQGPAEKKWGYTVLSVADWDGDGFPDLVVNSIWGKVVWFRNLGSEDALEMDEAKAIEVAWDGDAPKPAWNWWNPSGEELATQWRTTPIAMDWNGDGLCDLIVMDHEGWLAYYERMADGRLFPGKRIFYGVNGSVYRSGKGLIDTVPGPLRLNAMEAGASGRRKLCFTDWDGDGHLDLIVDGPCAVWWKGLGTKADGNYHLFYMGDLCSTRLAGHTTSPTPVFWSGKSVPDLLVGAEDGHFYLIKNERCSTRH